MFSFSLAFYEKYTVLLKFTSIFFSLLFNLTQTPAAHMLTLHVTLVYRGTLVENHWSRPFLFSQSQAATINSIIKTSYGVKEV
jgi:hypothetical protein